jgi:azurin
MYSTKIVDPGESFTLEFVAPRQAGAYPYICTFPGHWRIMQGTMNVVE